MTRIPASLILLASLALNLILIGIFTGMMLKGPGGHRDGRGLSLRPALTQEDRTERRLVRDVLRQVHKDAAAERKAHQEAKRRLYAALSAEPLDIALAESQFAALRQAEDAMRTRMQNDLLVKIPELSAEQRARIARRLLAGEHSNPRGRRGDRSERREP